MLGQGAKPTIYSVAARAGVSISTVSLAINQPQRVSAATRKRVAEAADAEGYRSRGGGSRAGLRTIAVAAPFSSWPSYYARLDGVLAHCAGAGVEVLVHDLPSPNEVEAPLLDALPVRGDLDGVIIMGTPLSAAAEESIQRSGTPTVLVDAMSEVLPTVTVDDTHGGRLLGTHLVDLGHRTVLYAHEGQVSDDYVSAGMRRFAGVAAAMAAAGGVVEPVLLDDGVLAAAERKGATAIVANHDALAAELLRIAAASGVEVPGTFSVTGYDGGALADALRLTTIVQPFTESGRAAAELLLVMLSGTAPSVRTLTLGCSLSVGATTASVAPS
ncbi:hypothetical protein BJH93_08220 [Kocuria polaris]|nr:hypothetical protein [Kocuria polaris]